MTDIPSMRLDKWLWHARFVKTRSLAQTLLTGGKVRLNGNKLDKASAKIRVNDEISFAVHDRLHLIKVAGLSDRRGPAPEARLLYEEIAPAQNLSERKSQAQRPRGEGRPSKKQRRQIDAFKKQGLPSE